MSIEKKKTTLNLPAGLWKATRIRAIEENRTVQDLVVDALMRHLGILPHDSSPRNLERRK